jgi:hypothetical protein
MRSYIQRLFAPMEFLPEFTRIYINNLIRFFCKLFFFHKEKLKTFLTYGKSFPQGVENFVKNSENVDVVRVFTDFIM